MVAYIGLISERHIRSPFVIPYMVDYIVIVSHRNYGEARNHLLKSLEGKWNMQHVLVVLNGEMQSSIGVVDGVKCICIPNNIYEYTGFFIPHILNAHDDDAFLLLHDTCYAMNDFRKRAQDAFFQFREKKSNILWCSKTGQCNICVFDKVTSTHIYRAFGGIHALDKMEAYTWNTTAYGILEGTAIGIR